MLAVPPMHRPGARVVQQDALDFLGTLQPASVDLIVTDPAYSGMNQHLMLGKGRIVGQYDAKGEGRWFDEFHDTPENYRKFLAACHRVLRPDRHLFIMFDAFSMLTLAPTLRESFDVKNVVTWDKVKFGMGHHFRRQTEFIVFASKGRRRLARRDIPDVWRIKRLHRASYPTQKPVELFEAMIASSKAAADTRFTVCDPFVGSGSAAIAALRQGADFIGCDVSARAVELARRRIASYLASGVDELQRRPAHDPTLQKKFW